MMPIVKRNYFAIVVLIARASPSCTKKESFEPEKVEMGIFTDTLVDLDKDTCKNPLSFLQSSSHVLYPHEYILHRHLSPLDKHIAYLHKWREHTGLYDSCINEL